MTIKVYYFFVGDPPDIDEPFGPYPLWVEQPNTKRKVPVIHAYYGTKYLGELWLEFDEAGEVVKSYGNPILLDYSIGQGIKYYNLHNIIFIVLKYFTCNDM